MENNTKLAGLIYKAHLVIYVFAMLVAFALVLSNHHSLYGRHVVAFAFFIGIVWGAVLNLHSRHILRHRSNVNTQSERQAYRDGFNDAMHDLSVRQDARLPRRSYLAADELIGEDGELYEEIPQEKYKRNY